MSKPVPAPDALWTAAWIAARVLEMGNTVEAVVWLAAQLATVQRGEVVSDERH